MSITGINGTSGTSAITRITAAAAPAADAAGAASAASRTAAAATTPPAEGKQDGADEQETSVHFPWLSRLSAELEAASKQRARFPTQIMGDHLDRKA